MAGLKVFLLKKYGIDGYDELLIYRQLAGWFFGILIMDMFIYTDVPIQRFLNRQQDRKDSTSTDEVS